MPSKLTPWLAKFCIHRLEQEEQFEEVRPPPKLVQILSRAGNFWTSHTAPGRSTRRQAASLEVTAQLTVTDGQHSISVQLSPTCQHILRQIHAVNVARGADPWILFQRGSVGLLQEYDLQIGNDKTKSMQLIVKDWRCQPSLHDMIVAGSKAANQIIQPVQEHIPVRRAWMDYHNDNESSNSYPSHFGDPNEVLQNQELLQTLMEAVATDNEFDDDDDDDDESSENTAAMSNPDDDDEQPILNLQDMLVPTQEGNPTTTQPSQPGEEEDEDDNNNEPQEASQDETFLTQPPMIPATNHDTDTQEADGLLTQPLVIPQAPLPGNTFPDEEESSDLLTQPPPTIPPAVSKNKQHVGARRQVVDSSTQTSASTLMTQPFELRLLLPSSSPLSAPPVVPRHPGTATEREITTPVSNTRSSHKRRPPSRPLQQTGDYVSDSIAKSQSKGHPSTATPLERPKPKSSATQSAFTKSTTKKKRRLETPGSTISSATGTLSSSPQHLQPMNHWETVCQQLWSNASIISIPTDTRLTDRRLLQQGGIARWSHKNVVSSSIQQPRWVPPTAR